MALNFPPVDAGDGNPTDGMIWTAPDGRQWKYDSTIPGWRTLAATGNSNIVYRGGIDLTVDPDTQFFPVASGNQFVVTVGADPVDGAFYPGLGGKTITEGAIAMYDGNQWQVTSNLPLATETTAGIVELADAAEALDTTNNRVVLTPERASQLTTQLISEQVPPIPTATEVQEGVVELANSAETLDPENNFRVLTPKHGHELVSSLVPNLVRGFINVKSFGAVGDGVTDDTAAVRDALNTESTVYFPAGRYRITSEIHIDNRGFKAVGDGQQSVLLFDAPSNGENLFKLRYNERNNYDWRWMFSDLVLMCKAVTGREHDAAIRVEYFGPGTVVGGPQVLTLNNVSIVSEIISDATQAYFKRGLFIVNTGGVVANNVFISSYSELVEDNPGTVGIEIANTLAGNSMIKTFYGVNVDVVKYHTGIKVYKTDGTNIESIYCTQGEIVCNQGIELDAGHATFFSGMHIECKSWAYKNESDGGPHRIVGCDLRGGRTGTEGNTDYLIKLGADWTALTGCDILCQMPTSGVIITGHNSTAPKGITITGNVIVGNTKSNYLALRCDNGSEQVTFGGNTLVDFGGNQNAINNTGDLFVYGQRAGNTL